MQGKKSKFLAQWIPEVQGTFDDLPSGRFLEKLALSDDRFGRWPFEDAYFDHYGWKDYSLRKLAFSAFLLISHSNSTIIQGSSLSVLCLRTMDNIYSKAMSPSTIVFS